MAKFLTTTKSALRKIRYDAINEGVIHNTIKALVSSTTEFLKSQGATEIVYNNEHGNSPSVSYRIDGIQRVHTFTLQFSHNDNTFEAITSQQCQGFAINQPQHPNYIKQIGNALLNCGFATLIQLREEILDAIEDKIINDGLFYLHCAMPLNGVTAKFVPYVTAMHPHFTVSKVREIVTPFGLAFMVDVIAIEQCKPEDDLLFEIGRVEYTNKSKRSSLYANTKGKIFSSALHHDQGHPILAAHFREFDNTNAQEYTDDNGINHKLRSAGVRMSRLSERTVHPPGLHVLMQPNDSLLLFDVTSQVLPLIRFGSRAYNFLQNTHYSAVSQGCK